MFDNGDDIAESPARRSGIADLTDGPDPAPFDQMAAARREFAVLLGEFRRSAVLVPLDAGGDLWSADQGGVRWICAFSDEAALARFAVARGEAGREWVYQSVLGARLLDVLVPLLPGPAGVALDAGSAEGGVLFPPVVGVVPDAVAVDLGGTR
ncbi:SseB family protein [Streptomyces niveus]|uniref:SseB family protein n=1 Tax=Streptomyces niveus TaxID=193462 RepID=UPI000AE61416|nr:SseB family protein [Streptomyces niveus]